MNFLEAMPPHVRRIGRAFAAAGHPIYAVGGAVRAAVLGLPATDYDLAGPATPQEAMAVVAAHPDLSARMLIPRLGTLHIGCENEGVEYTTFRTESYAGGHTPQQVAFTGELTKDALRRDFSCNALYLDLSSGEIEDPTGGMEAIARRELRATTSDPAVILRDDGLRVLRMVRFALQLRFTIETHTFACADANLLQDISRERLGQELERILLGDVRYDVPYGWAALVRALHQLRELGALEILLPGCPADDLACAEAPPHLPSRLAAWLLPAGAEKARLAMENLRFSGAVVNEAVRLIEDLSGEGDIPWRLMHRGRGHGARLAALRPAWQPVYDDLVARNAPDSLRKLAVNGEDIAGLLGGPSPKVGQVLENLWKHVLTHPEDNRREILLKLAGEERPPAAKGSALGSRQRD